MSALSRIRTAMTPLARPLRSPLAFASRSRRRARYLREGIAGIAQELRTTTSGHAAILREYGATVGDNVSFHAPLNIVNADGDFRSLSIGNNCHLGSGVLIDLADTVTIEDDATVSMRCTIITHIDVGPGPLKETRPRETGPVRIGRGAYLGAGATILHGATIGAAATVGAHALVDRDVAPGTTVLAPRARLSPGDSPK